MTEGEMQGEDQGGSTGKRKCKSQRELKRQNERASVVSCVLSSLGLASCLSGFNLKLMIYFWEGWKSQIVTCDTQTHLLFCSRLDMQSLLLFMQL